MRTILQKLERLERDTEELKHKSLVLLGGVSLSLFIDIVLIYRMYQ